MTVLSIWNEERRAEVVTLRLTVDGTLVGLWCDLRAGVAVRAAITFEA